jgi:hypothetical protein
LLRADSKNLTDASEVLTASSFRADGGSKYHSNFGQSIRDYMVQYPRRYASSYSPPREQKILLDKLRK